MAIENMEEIAMLAKSPSLIGDNPVKLDLSAKQDICALDEMFSASRRYRSSEEYLGMLNFISRLPQYSPFNCALLYTQDPRLSYVATARTWQRKFGRSLSRDARPLVILAPMSPVLFVYDMKDTEGDEPIPAHLLDPFQAEGYISVSVFNRLVENCAFHGIVVRNAALGHRHGGSAIPINDCSRQFYRKYDLSPSTQYLILLNDRSALEDQYSILVHELGHIFCGHLGSSADSWWPDRKEMSHQVVEIETESTAYLLCLRKNLMSNAEKHLSSYTASADEDIPTFSLNAILQATAYVEEMGKSKLFRPKKAKWKS